MIPPGRFEGRHIVLGVSGSIAAYKACILASLLVKQGAQVHPVLTRGGARFVTMESLTALCGRPTLMDEFDRSDPYEMTHISLAERAHAVVLAPASANLIARLAAGMANDMLTLLLTVTRAPVILAPAMNTSMWTHPIVAENVSRLVDLGYILVEPAEGRMACGTVGAGKLAEPEEIATVLYKVLTVGSEANSDRDLEGMRVLVTAGPTREPLDAVRFIGNRSSGKMGYALAEGAIARGALVTLISGPTHLQPPPTARLIRVETTAQLRAAVLDNVEQVDVMIGAAAVADFTVERASEGKLKRGAGDVVLHLTPTVDILAEVGRTKGRRFHVGFAAEVGDPEESARNKLARKKLDLCVGNDISAAGAGFDVDTNLVVLVDRDGKVERLPLLSKREVAARILDRVVAGLNDSEHRPERFPRDVPVEVGN